MFEEIFKNSLSVDESIVRQVGCLLVGCDIEEEFPELKRFLPDPLVHVNLEDPKSFRVLLTKTDQKLLEEWKKMREMLYLVNEDRKRLRHFLFKVLSEVAKGIPASNFEQFLAKSQNVNYELTKLFLEKARKKSESSVYKSTQTWQDSNKENVPPPTVQRKHSRIPSLKHFK